MPNLNKVHLMGNLTRDVELRTAGASQVGGFGLAINRKFKTGDGAEKEEVCFVDCEAWGKTAEIIAQYVRKGSPLYVEGRLKLDQWEKDGQKHSKLKVVVEQFQFLGDGKGEKAEAPAANQSARGYAGARAATKPSTGGHTPMREEEIPF